MRKSRNYSFITAICIIICIMMVITSCGGGKTPENTTAGNNSSTTEAPEATTAGNSEENTTETPTESTPSSTKVTYTVTVVDENGAPLSGATVQLCVGDQCMLPVATGANGIATFELDEAEYTVKVTLNGYTGEASYSFDQGSTELSVQLTKDATETTEAPATETTEAPATETTEAPATETTEAPATETTEAPSEETTEAPIVEPCDHRSASTDHDADYNAVCSVCGETYKKYVDTLWDKYLFADDMRYFNVTSELTDDGAKFIGSVTGMGDNLGAGNIILILEDHPGVPNSEYFFVKYKVGEGTTLEIAEQSVGGDWYWMSDVSVIVADGEWHVLVYQCTTDKAGTFKIYFNAPDGVTPTIEIAYAGFAHTADQVDQFLDAKDDKDIVALPSVEPVPGSSEENPIFPEFTWNDEWTEATTTVIAPVGTTYYAIYRANGLMLTINDGEAIALSSDSFFAPAIFTIVNDGDAEAEYTLKLAYPTGSQMNPEVIEDMSWYYGDVMQAAGNGQGYYYTYTAIADGTLTVYFGYEGFPEGYVCDITLYNLNSYVQKTLLADGVDNYGLEVSIDVKAGDEVQIIIVAVQDAEGNYYPEAEMTWCGSFAAPQGSEENPIYPEWEWDDAYANATVTVTVAAGETVYFSGDYGMILTIDGVVTEMSETGIFAITNNGETEATYVLAVATPIGANNNPEVIETVPGTVSGSLDENGSYTYSWTATEDSTVVITITAGANISVNNLNTYEFLEFAEPDIDDNWNYIGWIVPENLTITVAAGETITIQVTGLTDWETWMTPAIDYTLTIEVEGADADETCDHRSASTDHDADYNAVCSVCGETYKKYVDTLWDKYLFATDMGWDAELTEEGAKFVGPIKGNTGNFATLGSGNVVAILDNHPGVPNSEYFFVKYKVGEGTTLEIAEQSVGGDWYWMSERAEIIADGEWHVLIYQCTTDKAGTFKLYFNSDDADVAPTIEIAYAGFAHTAEQVEAFVAAN